MELFRDDELPDGFAPVMGYVSVTHPGVARGPHEHRDQADGFCFLSGTFRLTLWENRTGLERRREAHNVGEENPAFVVVPAGGGHAYGKCGAAGAVGRD